MDLTSGRVITRPRVHELPATDLVIKQVEHLARKDGIKTLKFADRNGQVIHTTDFLAGVGTQNGDDTDELMKMMMIPMTQRKMKITLMRKRMTMTMMMMMMVTMTEFPGVRLMSCLLMTAETENTTDHSVTMTTTTTKETMRWNGMEQTLKLQEWTMKPMMMRLTLRPKIACLYEDPPELSENQAD
jgi:hypothetical protein